MKLNYYSFKSLFIGFLFGFMPLGLVSGLFTLFGVISVNFNNKNTYGIPGFFADLFIFFMMTIIFSVFSFLFLNFGTWLSHLFFKKEE